MRRHARRADIRGASLAGVGGVGGIRAAAVEVGGAYIAPSTLRRATMLADLDVLLTAVFVGGQDRRARSAVRSGEQR